MTESVMHQAMETWLKQECAGTGIAFIRIAEYIDDIAEDMILDKIMMPSSVDRLKKALTQMESFGSLELGDPSEIMAVVDNHIREDNPHQLADYADSLEIKALEKTVVCQCGKPGEKYTPPAIKFPETEGDWWHLGTEIKLEKYHRYGERDKAFDNEVDDKVHAIQYNMPGSDDAKRWLMAKAGELDIKEY